MRKKKNLIIVVILFLFLAFLSNFSFADPLQASVVRALNPLFSSFFKIGSYIGGKFGDRTEKEQLLDRVAKLEELNIALTKDNADMKTAEDENVYLRQFLNYLPKNHEKFLLSDIISKDDITNLSKKSETVTINKGSRDGLIAGLPVVSSEGVIVGKVSEVRDSLSLVDLTNSSKCKLAATIFGQDKTSGITEGELGLTMRMDFIPQGRRLSVNDIAVTSGLESNIPRGLLIGRVLSINSDSNELWQKAVIEPIINSEDLVTVSVLMP